MAKSNKQLHKVLLSTLTGSLGSSILSFIIGLLILKETDSALYFGISQMIGPIVALILLPITGSIVDKYNRKHIIIYAQLFSIVSLIVYAIFVGVGNIMVTYVLLICLRVADQFLTTAFSASVIQIVSEEDVQKLRSYQQSLTSIVTVFAPIVGAIMFDLISIVSLVLMEVVLELITILIVMFIHFKDITVSESEGSKDTIFEMFKEGLQFIRKSKQLVFAITFAMLVNLMFGAISVGIPYILINVFQFPNIVYGTIETLLSVGMILCGIMLSTRQEIKYPLFTMWKMIGVIGILISLLGNVLVLSYGNTFNMIFMGIFALLLGIFITWTNVPVSIWMTKEIPPQYQGRVFNLLGTGSQLLMPLGIFVFSILFEVYDSAIIFLGSGIGIILITVLYPIVFRVPLKESKITLGE